MPEATGRKICVICGQDCAGRPRVRDPKGHYYCQDCYEKAKRRQEEARAASSPEPVAAPPPPEPPEPDLDDDFAGGLALLDEVASEVQASAPPPISACPGCGYALAPGAAICTACGYNLQTGRTLQATAVTAAPPVGAAVAGGAVWPSVVGLISVIFGGGGLILNLVAFIAQLDSLSGARRSGAVMGGVLAILLSAWLLQAGINIMRRKAKGVRQIRIWAIVKAILFGSCLTCLTIVFMSIPAAEFDSLQLEGVDASVRALVLGYLIGLLMWMLFWPIFVLVWFSRDRVQRDVREWS